MPVYLGQQGSEGHPYQETTASFSELWCFVCFVHRCIGIKYYNVRPWRIYVHLFWYYFNAEGYMTSGWFTDADGKQYYFYPVSDGNQGYIYTGWNLIDGKGMVENFCYTFPSMALCQQLGWDSFESRSIIAFGEF